MSFDYQSLMNEAVLNIIKKVLVAVQDKTIDSNQALYISFLTNFKGVVLSEAVKKQYPKEITIVLQHQFKNLKVSEDKFSVSIAFKGVIENIEVPFSSITNFLDPGANFGFQFALPDLAISENPFTNKSRTRQSKAQSKEHNLKVVNKKDNVVNAIDKFRKNRETEDTSL